MTNRCWFGVLLLGMMPLLVVTTPARGQFQPPMPKNLELVDFYLLTVGRGPAIHQNYGHTILRVVDWGAGLDMNFNWGMFDFHKPGFIKNFYQGRLRYRLGIQSYRSVIENYKEVGRSVIQDRIFLTEPQKRQLMNKIIWNAKPENREYDYHMYFDNCSTRPRDYLDTVLGGAIKARYSQVPAKETFRDIFRRAMAGLPLIVWGADITHNAVGDMPLTQWQEMFLPAKLKKYLGQMAAIGPDGKPMAEQKLLYDNKILVEAPEPEAAIDVYKVFLPLFVLPLIWAQMLLLVGGRNRSYGLIRLGLKILGGIAALFGLLAGIFGTLMILNWVFSGHEMLWHNANLWLFWPTDFGLVFCGLALLFRGASASLLHDTAGRLWAFYGAAHMAAMGAFIVLYLTGHIVQNVGKVLVFILPVGFLICALLFICWLQRGHLGVESDRQREELSSL